jgi:asparagine synthase (glutamine-hydrolysing)
LNRRVDEIGLARMRDTLTHRGPDDAGIYVNNGIGLGHRRLAIVDVGGGHQPMSTGGCGGKEKSKIWITFNGEIYNHPQLRPLLEAREHRYQTASDTETILHLYEERGPGAVEELSGMFAFAIWDEVKQRLLLARDRLGIKPLYYFLSGEGALYFASEIKALLASGAVAPEANLHALPDYLANHAPTGQETMFRDIKRLLPGHLLIWENGAVQIREYWNATFESGLGDQSRNEREYIDEWRELFCSAVRSHLMSDVPLGMFLSGGIDSTAITAVMSQETRDPVKTFSVAFNEAEANELEFARLVARHYNTEHHEVIISGEEFFSALPRLVWHEDEPLAHTASPPLYFVSELAARHVKVVLTGEGSDELLAGYHRYHKTVANLALGRTYHNLTPGALRSVVRTAINRLPANSTVRRKLSRTFLYLKPEMDEIYYDNFAVFSRAMQSELLTTTAKRQIGSLDPYAGVRELLESTDAKTPLNQLLYADLKTYLHELLMKQDQMSMAASLESRVPFLDWALVEFSTRLPERLKLRGWTTKYVMREALKDILPPEIKTRRKIGFPVPTGAWLRGKFSSVLDEYLLSERAAERGLFDRTYVERLVAEHKAGVNHAYRLWILINFEIWMRQFIDAEPVERSARAMAAAAAAN